MKPINALLLALVAGASTFVVQNEVFSARLHAAPYIVPTGSNWREQMLDRYPGGPKVDHVVARISDRLDLTTRQAAEAHAILRRHHDEILALLLAAPRSMTRAQFVIQEHQAWAQTRKQLDALLTPDQLELVQEVPQPS
jgi:hypothetical protein